MTLQWKSIRLLEYDYAAAGAYFVPLCTRGRRMILARVEGEAVRLSSTGEIVNSMWNDLPAHFSHVKLDDFVVMPNHLHGIVWIAEDEGVSTPLLPNVRPSGPKRGSLAAIIGSFKFAVSREINRRGLNEGHQLWQRNYYEHVIRDEQDLFTHRRYIRENPLRWQLDEYHA